MASKSQQKAWAALLDDEQARAPTGAQLKAWLFGGQSIACQYALFDVETSGLAIVADLFGEGGYFADPDAFWVMQNEAIEARRTAYLQAGWSEVVLVPTTAHFSPWEMERTPKRRGGRVYIDVRTSGEICFHEGYVSRKEATRGARGEVDRPCDKPVRAEMTSAMQAYVDLHRHAAVRADLIGHPQVALRLMVAHAMAGSPLWRVDPDSRRAPNDSVAESVEGATAEAAFDGYRRAALGLLRLCDDEPSLVGRVGRTLGVAEIFARLMGLPDDELLAVLAVVMGETLAVGSAAVAAVGQAIGTDMARWWQADDAFFDGLRDREVLVAMVGEVAGDLIARANAREKGKTLKAIVRAHLAGDEGRTKVEGWVPRWMRFPASAYTARGQTTASVLAIAAMSDDEVGGPGEHDADPGIDAPDDPTGDEPREDEAAGQGAATPPPLAVVPIAA